MSYSNYQSNNISNRMPSRDSEYNSKKNWKREQIYPPSPSHRQQNKGPNNYYNNADAENTYLNNEENYDQDTHNYNIERTIMERGALFNYDTKQERYPASQKQQKYGEDFPTSNNFGEITGSFFEHSQIDQGMPMRGFLDSDSGFLSDTRDSGKDLDQDQEYNPSLDFDLYDKKPAISVSYFDPFQTNRSANPGFANIEETANAQILALPSSLKKSGTSSRSTVTIDQTVTTNINMFTLEMLDKFISFLPSKGTTVSPYSIMVPFMMMYRGSGSLTATEEECQAFFSLPDKESTFLALAKISKQLDDSPCIVTGMAILIPTAYPVNKAFVNYMGHVGLIQNIDLSNPEYTVQKINYVLNNVTNGLTGNLINPNMLNINTGTIMVSIMHCQLSLKYPGTIRTVQFLGKSGKRPEQMICLSGVNLLSYNDNDNQIVELDTNDKNLSLGLILPSRRVADGSSSILPISHNQLAYYISQLRMGNMDNVEIPHIKRTSRYKIDSLFKKMGLREIFTNADFSDVVMKTPNVMYVSDIVHMASISVSALQQGQRSNPEGPNVQQGPNMNSNRNKTSFVANRPFTYYVRYRPTNLLLFIGQFN